ncbi:MAG: hypothetical protein KC944_11590 [Candidatus Omnitrophica bacterium]|nr:hypothetical protein [Candidatus Omnitrophota bacterium]
MHRTTKLLYSLTLTLVVVQPLFAADLTVSPSEGVQTQGWSPDIFVDTLSSRTVSLSITPQKPEKTSLSLRCLGLDPGDYYLVVSGQDPRVVSQGDLASGVQVTLPGAIGALAEPLKESTDLWFERTEEALAVSEDFGYPWESIPMPIRNALTTVREAGEGLEKAVASKSIRLRVTPVGAGPIPLTSLSELTPEEIESRRKALHEDTRKLIQLVSDVDEPAIRREVLAALIPIDFSDPRGSALNLAAQGKTGKGDLSLTVSNHRSNPLAEVHLDFNLPEGWKTEEGTTMDFSLAPGESREIQSPCEIVAPSGSGRVCIPVEASLDFDGIKYKTQTGLGYGHEFIRKWSIIGPFAFNPDSWLTDSFPPEKEVDMDAAYQGPDGKVQWKQLDAEPNGRLNLLDNIHPTQGRIAYAATWLYSPKAQDVTFPMGYDDGIQAWLNGEEIYEDDRSGAIHLEEFTLEGRLKKGWNQLLFSVSNTAGDWGLACEIRDDLGGTPEGLKVSATPPEE